MTILDDDSIVSYLVDEEILLVQCYDYESGDTFFWKWDGEEYEKVEDYEASDGTVYEPIPQINKDIDGNPEVNLAEEPVDYGSFDSLVKEITEFINGWIDLEDEDIRMCAYYIVFTWVFDKSTKTPYLRFMGEPSTGKSKMVSVVGSLCFMSRIFGSTTFSSVRDLHHLWKGTCCFDEADYMSGSESKQYVNWINNGINRKRGIYKTDADNHDKKKVRFPFGPKVFAMRRPFEDAATETRMIPIETRKGTDFESYQLTPEFYDEALELRNKLLDFRMKNYSDIDPHQEPQRIVELDLDGRIKDIFFVLYPIVQKGGEEAVEQLEEMIIQRQKQLRKDQAQIPEGMIFNTLVDIATNKEATDKFDKFRPHDNNLSCVKSGMIEEQLGHNFDKRKIGRTLSSMQGIETKNQRVEVEKQKWKDEGLYKEVEKEQHRCIVFKRKSEWLHQLKRYRENYEDEDIEMPDCLKSTEFIDDTEEGST